MHALMLALVAAAAQERVPWTASRISGSPEPPAPFRTVRAFPRLTFKKPVHLVPFPGRARYVLIEEEAKLWTIRNDPACEQPDLFCDLRRELRGVDRVPNAAGVGYCYAIAFDPDFERSRVCYVMYILLAKGGAHGLADGSRVSRFRVTRDDPPRLDPASEEVVLTWVAGGHNGCDLQFGNDGFLYISTGDATEPSPPDQLRTGQDLADLLSCILRIDVRGAGPGRPYAIPPDNPFVGVPGAREEIWCYGLRNPWRMSFDRPTGRLWIGDVGWERWELIFVGERGANFGWSVMEGPDVCLPDARLGPTPIVPPAHAIPHTVGASISGGFVYHGKRLAGLEGHYLYGDWDTRRIWANPVRGATLGERRELARTTARVIAFAEDADGEPLILDHEGGGIWRLEPADAAPGAAEFPRTLGATGLFASVSQQTPAPGVIAYTINAPAWTDGAVARRWLAIPNLDSIRVIDKNQQWPKESIWPRDSVLAKTLWLDGRKVETQILHYDGDAWNAYAYVWRADQSDATLAPAEGVETDLGGGRVWKTVSRAACMTCHNPWPGTALTFNAAQLGRPGLGAADQIRALQDWKILPEDLPRARPLVDPADEAAPLEARARSYLAVNCAHCHRFGGGGAARIDLRHDIPIGEMRAAGVPPTLGGFDLTEPLLICGGDPSRSVLVYRASKLGPGRMPHLGSERVDVEGVRLLSRWIESLGPSAARAEDRRALERCRSGEAAGLDRLLGSVSGAMDLLSGLEVLPGPVREAALKRALDLPPGPVRDLFERFEPPERRRQKLGPNPRPESILARSGEAARGRRLFESSTVQCARCHRPAGEPPGLGADLSKIGAKYTRAQLLESILEPSKTIDPAYAGYLVQTKGAEVYSGILVSRGADGVVVREQGREVRVAAGDVAQVTVQKVSLMPDGLIQHLTAQEAADLLAYLESLR
jgi:putative heme-binding domain-containing protein